MATLLWGGLGCVAGCGAGPAFRPRVGVGDGKAEGLELGDEGFEPAVVVEPLLIVIELVIG